MRELDLTIDEALQRGLTPLTDPATNEQWLLDCLGFRCCGTGLEAYSNLENPLPVGLDLYYSWPYPQVVTGEKYMILVVRNPSTLSDSIYSVSADHSSLELIYTTPVSGVLHNATLMEVADFGKYVFMTNGAIMFYWDPEVDQWQRMIAGPTTPIIRTVCNFKGQAIGGCVLEPWWHELDETYYVWSKIGSFDFTPDNDNEAGFRRCPYGGEVYHVRRLGDGVVGYSSKGITLIFPVADPTVTYGFKELSNIGLLNRGAVNGDYSRQVYVGEDYKLREITSEGVKELGYKNYMEQLTGDIIISYDPSKRDFYIGNSTKTYLLSPYGMTEIMQHPSAVWRWNKETCILPETADANDAYLKTNNFDMGYRGQKTVFSMESDITNATGVEYGVDCAYDLANWNEGHYTPANNMGIGVVIASGNILRLRLKTSSISESAKLSYVRARYKMTDLKGIRGVYSKPSGGDQE